MIPPTRSSLLKKQFELGCNAKDKEISNGKVNSNTRDAIATGIIKNPPSTVGSSLKALHVLSYAWLCFMLCTIACQIERFNKNLSLC